MLVVAERWNIVDATSLAAIRDGSMRIAAKKGHAISRLSVMPDHLHATMRANIEHSPADVALSFLNNLTYLLNQGRLWQDSCYLGTFGEYDMQAIREQSARATGGSKVS